MLPSVVLFQGIDSSGNGGLWETDGTVVGTFELTGIAGAASTGLYPVDLSSFNANEEIFGGADVNSLVGLWETDGTAAGTHELTGIAGAATTAAGLYPYNLMAFNGKIVFGGYDATGSIGLWVSDGTAAGTHELTGIAGAATTASGLDPDGLMAYHGEILFSGWDATGGIGLWVSDGTAAGTHELTVTGAWGQGALISGLSAYDLSFYDDLVFFNGRDTSGQLGLWETDGTASGTKELIGIVGAADSGLAPSDLTALNGHLFFNGSDSNGELGLWETDGTAAGTHELTGVARAADTGLDPSDLTAFNGLLLFSGLDSSGQIGLWETDGSVGGTHELTGVAGAADTGLNPSDLTVFNGHVLFSGLDSSGQIGLWETDGTAAGTHELTGIVGASTASFAPSGLTATTMGRVPGPVLTAGASVTYVIGGPPVTLDAALSVVDAAAVSLSSATVRVSAGFVQGDTLSVGSPQTGIVSQYNATTGVLTLSGSASLASYKAELDSITYASAKAATSSRTITWSVNDGVNASAPATSQVSVSSAPSVPVPDLNILWQNTSGQAAIWEMNGTNLIGAAAVGGNPGPSWKAIGTGDFNDDGHSDILWQKTNGQAAVWEMNGTNVIGAAAVGPNPGPAWKAIGTGDFNDDGNSDILWQNASGQAAIWEMNGTNVISAAAVSPNPGPSWHAIVA